MSRQNTVWMVIGVIGAAAALVSYLYIVVSSGPVRFGAVAVAEPFGSLRLVFGYLMTIVGVVLGTAYRNLQSLRDRGQSEISGVGLFVRSVFLSIEFWLGLCGSPLVYALLVRSTEGGGLAGLTAVAIQNGFFCTVIVAGLAAKPQTIAASGAGGSAVEAGSGSTG